MSTQTRGHGILQISCGLSSELGNPSTPKEWHKVLLLPDTFTVDSFAKNDRQDLYELTVSSDFLPDEEGIYITPIYTKHFNGEMKPHVTLDKIEFTQWDGEHWINIGRIEVVS